MSELHTVPIVLSENKVLELFIDPIRKDSNIAWNSANISTVLNKFSTVHLFNISNEDQLNNMIEYLITDILTDDLYRYDEILKVQIVSSLNYLKNIKEIYTNELSIVEIKLESQSTKNIQTFYAFNASTFNPHLAELNNLFKYLNKFIICKEFSSYIDILYILLPHVYGSEKINSF